ncbi:glycoside hydrolase family 5 protein [Curtobacterium poinsettiae]|uniref:glycoside hydrolase family 5 protein n=1 Tax=Curtobacterium poinsettiae TaxID=159612 RepID=UPI00235EF1C2|nr:glycoside hydrolase family 5 protein [Curtobacterium flaccumfaciens]MDD1386782.1 glycoside hydrolase family 5 protein [Curtobacterium flaccumfaciens pv. poinsettiae]
MSEAKEPNAEQLGGGVSRRSVLGIGGALLAGSVLWPNLSTPAFAAQPRSASTGFTMGVNLSGMESGSKVPGKAGTDYAVPGNAELDYLKARGLTHVRVPFKWERMQPALNGALDSTYLSLYQGIVQYAGSIGLLVMLDNHNYGRYAGNPLGSSSTPISALADLWTRLAAIFKSNAAVYGYDLMNEPHDMPTSAAWPSAAQAAVDAIRAVDTATTIYVEGDGWSSAASWATKNAQLTIADPADNIVYSAHSYFDRDSSGTHYDWNAEVAAGDQLHSPTAPLTVDTGKNRVAAFAAWLSANGFRGHIGETGTAKGDPNWLTALDRQLAYCQQTSIPVTYWSAGPWFKNYALGVEPTAGKDTVQMAVLTKYSGGASPTAYYLKGPDTGGAGVASGPFTVDYRGYVTTAFTVTPHATTSNGDPAGGTFTPTSLAIEPGFNGVATFTYTAPEKSVYQISTTNSGALTDPPAQTFSTTEDAPAFGSVPDAALLNILATHRHYDTYSGNALTLRRNSDGAISSFPFLSSGNIDTAAVGQWAASSKVSVQTWNDQSPAHHDAKPITTKTSNIPLSSPSDYPEFVANGLNGLPVLRFQKSRMDAVSPISNLTGFTCFVVAKPTSLKGMQRLLSWVVTDYVSIGNATGGWEISKDSPVAQPMGVDPTAWHIYAVRWDGEADRTTWVDGTQIATAPAARPTIALSYNPPVNIGYFRYADGVFFDGDVYGIFPFATALNDWQMNDVWKSLSDTTKISVNGLR